MQRAPLRTGASLSVVVLPPGCPRRRERAPLAPLLWWGSSAAVLSGPQYLSHVTKPLHMVTGFPCSVQMRAISAAPSHSILSGKARWQGSAHWGGGWVGGDEQEKRKALGCPVGQQKSCEAPWHYTAACQRTRSCRLLQCRYHHARIRTAVYHDGEDYFRPNPRCHVDFFLALLSGESFLKPCCYFTIPSHSAQH